MKFPLSWLADVIDLSDISPEMLSDTLIRAGFEVEGIHHVGQGICHIVTGRIESLEKHPNADRLQITQIFDGSATHQIVTGAQNIQIGDVVPVSVPGAVLASGLKIKPSTLRGVPSNGMLCSKTELGIDEPSDGIWILNRDTPLGLDFVNYAQLNDVVFDISILPNRGDCQSILGMAREISVLLNRPVRFPDRSYSVEKSLENRTIISIEDPDQCPLYRARFIDGIRGDSPLWMQRRLALSGVRSHNLIVDITNYVLLETGQPLHAFDLTHWSGDHIVVSSARDGELVQTLDHEVRALRPGAPVIRDGAGIVAIAGVMGGSRASVTNDTTQIVLESAYFSPVDVRKSRSFIGLRTESAIRFERGVDPSGVQSASDRALHLLQTLGGARVADVIIESKNETHPILMASTILLVPAKINALLGTSYADSDLRRVLESLGFSIHSHGADWVVTIPSWRRHDIHDWPCLAEEVARILGLDNIPEVMASPMVVQEPSTRLSTIKTATEQFWVTKGFQEIQTYTMVSPDDFKSTKVPMPSEWLQIQNPLTPNESVLRRYLMASLLKTVSFNIKRQASDLRLFEVGKVFYLDKSGEVRENCVCGVICTGNQLMSPYTIHDKAKSTVSFSDLNGLARELLDALGISEIALRASKYPQYHPTLSADLWVNDQLIGNVGMLHPDILDHYDIRDAVGYIGLNLSAIASIPLPIKRFQPFGRFPSTRRDLAFVAPKSLGFDEVEREINAHLPEDVVDYFLFDLFESDALGTDNKSMALGFIYQNNERTLSDDEVTHTHSEFVSALCKRLNVTLR